MHKQAPNGVNCENIFLDKSISLRPSTGAVNRVNKRFHMVWIGKLRDAVAEIKHMPCGIFVEGEFVQNARRFALNRGRVAKQNMRIKIALQRDNGGCYTHSDC